MDAWIRYYNELMFEQRSDSIDGYRGLAILGMVLANYLAGVNWIPTWLKHAPDVGFTIIDLVAPMFIFAIGLTYGLSAQRRIKRDGAWKMTQHFIGRYFAILGMGALFSAGEILLRVDDQTINWGVLQAIGVAGLITLMLIRTPAWVRFGAGLVILAGYQFLLDRFWLQSVLLAPHGGLLGSISWSAMLLLATVLADWYHSQKEGLKKLGLASALTLLAGLILSIWVAISKNRVSAPYVLVSLGLSGLVFVLIHFLTEHFKGRLALLILWGKNPLILYGLHLLLLGLVVLPNQPGWYADAPAWLVTMQTVLLLLILTVVAWLLDRRKKYFRA